MSRFPSLVSMTLVVLLAGCSQDGLPPTLQAPAVADQLSAPKTQSDSLALVHHVAKHLALSLADSRVRTGLLATLERTKVREHKVHLQRFLKHRGAGWGAQVSELNGLGEAGWKDELLLLPDLEMYLPVEAHRRNWRGTADILVLGEVRDEADIRAAGGNYTAFDIDGEAYLLPMNSPPARPVLSIVPVETSFSSDGESPGPDEFANDDASLRALALMCDNTCPPPPNPDEPPPPPGSQDSLVLYRSTIYNISQYEGWGAGAPEFMILLKAHDPNSGRYTTVINCAGEGVVSPRGFNQDTDTWFGRVHMALRPNLQVYLQNQRDPVFWVYENDNDPKCDFNPTEHEDVELTVALAATAGTGVGIKAIIKVGNPFAWAYTIATAAMAITAYWHALSGDEFIGIATVPAGQNPSTNPKTIMNEEAPQQRGLLYMEWSSPVSVDG